MRRLSGLVIAVGALAALLSLPGQAGAQDARRTLNMFQGRGNFQVQRMQVGQSTFYIPQGQGPFNVLVWGNGTGGTAATYQSLLTSYASFGIVVAAANTANSGSGMQMQAAFRTALQMSGRQGNPLSGKIAQNPRVCTSGHSQGGGGTFNAARLINADCGIGVQVDATFTIRIAGAVPAKTQILALGGQNDGLAPLEPRNLNSIRRNTPGVLIVAEIPGINHFEPLQQNGGDLGPLARAFAVAQLRDDALAAQARTLFFGPQSGATIEGLGRGVLTRAERNDAAKRAQ